MSLPWFRMYAEMATDPDVQSLAFEDQRHWVMLLCFKCMGVLDKEYPSRERRYAVIRRGLGLDTHTCDEAKRRLIEAGLIDDDWQPLSWDKRQYQSDSSTARVQRHRERQRAKRPCNVSETPPDTDTDTEPEKNPPSGGAGGQAPQTRAEAATATPSASKGKGHRLPDEFQLTPERMQVAVAEGLKSPERTFAKFCDYWRAESGAKARKRDWDAAWRNWCRNERDRYYGGPGGSGPSAPRKTRFEQHMESIDAS